MIRLRIARQCDRDDFLFSLLDKPGTYHRCYPITNIIRDQSKNGKDAFYMIGLIIIVMIVGLAGIISNQYSALRRMEHMQRSLDELNIRLQEMNHHPKP